MIYFDNAATTPVYKEVADEVVKVLTENFGNPDSLHKKGYEAEKLLETARLSLSKKLNCSPSELYFTSNATEANNIAIFGHKRRKNSNIIISNIEHSSILEASKKISSLYGVELRICPVDNRGFIDLKTLKKLVDENTSLVSIMHINNELGTIQPISEIVDLVRMINKDVHIHSDGVQAFSKIDVDLKKLGVDSYTISAHKIGGPKGVGLLYINKSKSLSPIIFGGGQEKGIHPGTRNVAFSIALDLASSITLQKRCCVDGISKLLRTRLKEIDDIVFFTPIDSDMVSPFITSIGIKGIKGEVLLHSLEMKDIYISTGSACSGNEPSRILKAIGANGNYSEGAIRISLFVNSTEQMVNDFVDILKQEVYELRKISGSKRR